MSRMMSCERNDVQETKRFILQRLAELREIRGARQAKLNRAPALEHGQTVRCDGAARSILGQLKGRVAAVERGLARERAFFDVCRLTGRAEDGMLIDVLQILHSNEKSGRFSLFVGTVGEPLDVIFHRGEIIHAQAGDLEGEAAFFSIVATGQRCGRYGFVEGDHSSQTKKTIERNTPFLILEALRRADEGLRETPAVRSEVSP